VALNPQLGVQAGTASSKPTRNAAHGALERSIDGILWEQYGPDGASLWRIFRPQDVYETVLWMNELQPWPDDVIPLEGTMRYTSTGTLGRAALSGHVVAAAGSNSTVIQAGVVTEAMQVLADNTTQDVSTSKHGYAPKAPNDVSKVLDGTGAWRKVQMILTLHANGAGALTRTDQVSGAAFMNGNDRNIWQVDLTNFTQVRLSIRVTTGSASANNPRVRLRYHTAFSTTIGDYSDIGTSEVACSLASTGVITSSWIDLASGAKADIFLIASEIGGDGAADPVYASVAAHFR